MTVISAKEWLALLTFGALIVCTLIWAFLGSLPSNVAAEGILIRRGGVNEVVAVSAGQVTSIHVQVGDFVAKDEAVAEIAQPDLLRDIEKKQAELTELRFQHEELAAFGTKNLAGTASQLELRKSNLRANIAAAERRVTWLRQKIASEQELFSKSLITRPAMEATKLELEDAQAEIQRAHELLRESSLDAQEKENLRSMEIKVSLMRIHEAERVLTTLQARYRESSTIVSPHNGRVIELRVNPGDLVSPGMGMLSLDPLVTSTNAKQLELLLYVAASEGKMLQPNMRVRASPSTAKREEYGFIEGRITFVSEFPASRRGVLRALGNEELVTSFLQRGPVLLVRAELLLDPTTPTGFEWSSGIGPDEPLTAGTLCTATITVREQPPIFLLLPQLKDAFRG